MLGRVGLSVALAVCTVACQDDGETVDGGTEGSGETGSDAGGDDGSSGGGTGSTTGGAGTSSTDDGGSDTSSGSDPPGMAEPGEPGISVAYPRGCRIDADGALWCWGNGGSCGLGDGTSWARAMARIGTDDDWQQVSAGDTHTCAVKQDGSLWCWGTADDGRLGIGPLEDEVFVCRREPEQVGADGTWAKVAVGIHHTCAIRTDASLWCWGENDKGQIGDGSVGPLYTRLEPARIGRDRHWAEVSAGWGHTCAREDDGTLWCWGGTNLLGDGTSGWSSTPVLVDAPPAVALAEGSGSNHTCAIDDAGALWCWGQAGTGVLATEDSEAVVTPAIIDVGAPVAEAAISTNNTCVVRDDGELWCWGYNSSGHLLNGKQGAGESESTPARVGTRSDWIDVSVGRYHICARDESGADHCWGNNEGGEVGAGTSGSDNSPWLEPAEVGVWAGGTPSSGWASVGVGNTHGCGRRDDGSLWCWGNRYRGALGTGDDVADCHSTSSNECHVTTPVPVAGAGWDTLSVGGYHTCALRNGGELWCWGSNRYAEAGDGGTEDVRAPTQLGTDTDWTQIAAGMWHTCALRGTGTLWCWGNNTFGESGGGVGGVDTTVPTPTQVGTDTDWLDAAVGQAHTCGIRSGGSLWCWGLNSQGQIGDGSVDMQPPGENDPVNVSKPDPTQVSGTGYASVAVGSSHTCAIRDDGSLWCWGRNVDGQLGVGVPAPDAIEASPQRVGSDTDWTRVIAGSSSTCGRRTDGSVWCWGENRYGQVGMGEVDFEVTVDRPAQVGSDTDWAAISMTYNSVCGLRGDVIWCWGSNYTGQLGNDTIFNGASPTEVIDDG